MLTELRVENLGIIAEVRLVLGPGLTAITGETGAGKTLLVDALDLLVGGRADPSAVREGATEARVEGRFVRGEEETVLSRVVPVTGRSRAYVDGRLATAGELAERGRHLVDLHGQHSHQSLLAASEQRALLDRFAGPEALQARDGLREARATLRRVDAALAALGGDERSRLREADLLRYQLAEIEGAAIDGADEDERLVAEESLLAGAEDHRDALVAAYERLAGPATDALGGAVADLAAREPFAAVAERVRALQAETAELARDLRAGAEGVVADPERLQAIGDRRRLLGDLRRKYGASLAEVTAYADEVRIRLGELDGHAERAAALEAEREHAEADLAAAAAVLSRARRAAGGPLGTAVGTHLRELAMPAARFEVVVGADPAGTGEDGADEVAFLLAPNPGEPPRPLARAASGGELSRAMLALRVVLSEAPPTLVFDEVDAGIGGEVGVAVGKALASLGRRHQVLVVTHLPQVAAFADAQLAVEKREENGRTVAAADLLLDEARIAELSRMLAGAGDSAHARRHARELLTRCAEQRASARVE